MKASVRAVRAVFICEDGEEVPSVWVRVTDADMAAPHSDQSGGSASQKVRFLGWEELVARLRRCGAADQVISARAQWRGPIALVDEVLESKEPQQLFEASVLAQRAVSRLMVRARAAMSVAGEVGPGVPGTASPDSQQGEA